MKAEKKYHQAQLREMYSQLYEKGTGQRLSDSAARKQLQLTAHHESGHLVANAFFGRNFDEILSVSVVPDLDFGRCGEVITSAYQNTYQHHTAAACVEFGWCSDAWQLLIITISGLVAEARKSWDIYAFERLEQRVFEYDKVSPGSDVDVIRTIIEGGAKNPRMTDSQILRFGWLLAEDMMGESEVWRTTTRLARRLTAHGEINEFSVLMKICRPILGLAWELPKWRERLLSKGSEATKVFHEVLQSES